MLLLLEGDLESNPGPCFKNKSETMITLPEGTNESKSFSRENEMICQTNTPPNNNNNKISTSHGPTSTIPSQTFQNAKEVAKFYQIDSTNPIPPVHNSDFLKKIKDKKHYFITTSHADLAHHIFAIQEEAYLNLGNSDDYSVFWTDKHSIQDKNLFEEIVIRFNKKNPDDPNQWKNHPHPHPFRNYLLHLRGN